MTPSILAVGFRCLAAMSAAAGVDLRESVEPTAVKRVADEVAWIKGRTTGAAGTAVRVRVTTSSGGIFETRAPASAGAFACRYPHDFAGAPPLSPLLLYVDATSAAEFGGVATTAEQAEALLIVAGEGRTGVPDFPQVFTDGFIDAAGKKDAECAQFARNRTLTKLFFQSRAARLMHIQRPAFDLAKPDDFAWFKTHASLYEFDHRDRDWATPLGHRVARGFWQAMWNRWFNPTNDHPWDGNPQNQAPDNFRPYTFANDPADLAVLYQMQRATRALVPDDRATLVDEVMQNILAMQHRGAANFALPEASGKQQHFTAGAFRYGMFASGEWLTEGTGWFANPVFRDFEYGGVLNGRCVWAMGETLKADPQGPRAAQIRAALPLTLRFCLHDALEHGYARRTASGLPLWGYPGEHGYLLLGMLAASESAPELPVALAADATTRPLREVCVDALNALAESAAADGTWTDYANVNAVNIAALAEGVRVFGPSENSTRWKVAAIRAADTWIALQPLPTERQLPTPMFGHRKQHGMTYFLGSEKHAHISLYMNGHWLDALARLHAVTKDARYRARAQAIAAYYCGANPLHLRLLNELGAVNNRVTDSDGDGIEDQLGWDAYPESTAFVQIGLLHLLAP